MSEKTLSNGLKRISIEAMDKGFRLSYDKKVKRPKRQKSSEFEEPYMHKYMEEAYEDSESVIARMMELLGENAG